MFIRSSVGSQESRAFSQGRLEPCGHWGVCLYYPHSAAGGIGIPIEGFLRSKSWTDPGMTIIFLEHLGLENT